MGYALPVSIQMTEMECGECGISFCVPESWRSERQKNGTGWFCPNGHSRIYRESDVQKLTKQLSEEKERTRLALCRENEERARADRLEKERKRLAKRAHAGTCPCCNRTFQQLARHMKTKHPDHGAST